MIHCGAFVRRRMAWRRSSPHLNPFAAPLDRHWRTDAAVDQPRIRRQAQCIEQRLAWGCQHRIADIFQRLINQRRNGWGCAHAAFLSSLCRPWAVWLIQTLQPLCCPHPINHCEDMGPIKKRIVRLRDFSISRPLAPPALPSAYLIRPLSFRYLARRSPGSPCRACYGCRGNRFRDDEEAQ